MVSSRVDYLTLTLKPTNEYIKLYDGSLYSAREITLGKLKGTLKLDDLMQKMTDIGHVRNYAHCFLYENISIKLPEVGEYCRQGVCIEFSSKGLDYFSEYLSQYNLNMRLWLGRFRKLCLDGFNINVSRFDYAIDDCVSSGSRSIISLKRVLNAIENGELCCRSSVWSDQGSDFQRLCSFKSNHKRLHGQDVHGLTVQIGSRNSSTCCRFYDKFAEQLHRGEVLPADIVAWTRCEFELKRENAFLFFNHYIDDTREEFTEFAQSYVMTHLRFVERTSDNVSRCVTRRWWREFLNRASSGFESVKPKPQRTAFARFSRSFKKQWLPSFSVLLSEWGAVRVFKWIKTAISDEISNGRELDNPALRQNLKDGLFVYDSWSSLDKFFAFSNFDNLDSLINKMNFDYDMYQNCVFNKW